MKEATLLGVKVIWWARFGKLLQFVAGTVAVIDLVGPERFDRIASRFKRASVRKFSKRMESSAFSNPAMHQFISVQTVLKIEHGEDLTALSAGAFAPIFALLVAKEFSLGSAATLLLLLGSAALLALSIKKSLFSIFRFLSYLSSIAKDGNSAKWTALALVFIGFGFDMLGS
ncbi:hypothetical protein QFW96_23125 [Saccharopolyspora sp. TS4A08]|uniref:SLC26A/SulP transporter domain-containing protein n=1 Tax=Saccharopolyspora ipomoeae TaxID=3042027 RepID=A0ABT6PU56_9PSEU|nr:hypothetical protein [Saccharopolyspora sp. TS4A08]MDI2031539.1 hypothetical protein [Saccharopolyspora sp. TS4A08]